MCVWFAASEHLGFPEPHQGFWGMKLVGQAWELGALGSPALVESEGRGGCSSAHPPISSLFFPILNSFLTSSMPWLLLLLLLCVCQPGELCGLFPGSLSMFQSQLALWADSSSCQEECICWEPCTVGLLPPFLQLH